MRIRPKAIVKKLTRKINTGSFIEKYGQKTGASIWGASLGTLAVSSIKGSPTGTLPTAAIVGANLGFGLVMLSKVLPKKLVNEPIMKLMGKPRLAREVSKNVKDTVAKSTLYLIANARTEEEKQELTNLIGRETSNTNWKTILRIAKRASAQQNDELSKRLYVQLRGQRGIPIKLLDHGINRLVKAVKEKQVTTSEEYTNRMANDVLPFAVTHAMDVYGITNKEAKTKIFEALKKQVKRTMQKYKFGADITPQALIQDIKMIEYGEEFSNALKEATPNHEIQKQAFGTIAENVHHLMNYMHSRVSAELLFETIFKRANGN